MAYLLYIERNSPITVDEWLSAVEMVEGVKIDESDSAAINPLTDDEIRIPSLPGTAALWFSEINEWVKVFQFRRGRISFNAADWDNANSPVRDKASELAEKLHAKIIGDEGESC